MKKDLEVTATMVGYLADGKHGPQVYFGRVVAVMGDGRVLCRWWMDAERAGWSWLEGADVAELRA